MPFWLFVFTFMINTVVAATLWSLKSLKSLLKHLLDTYSSMQID